MPTDDKEHPVKNCLPTLIPRHTYTLQTSSINIFTIFVNSNPHHHPSPSISNPFSSSTKIFDAPLPDAKKSTFIEQEQRKLVHSKKKIRAVSNWKNRNVRMEGWRKRDFFYSPSSPSPHSFFESSKTQEDFVKEGGEGSRFN